MDGTICVCCDGSFTVQFNNCMQVLQPCMKSRTLHMVSYLKCVLQRISHMIIWNKSYVSHLIQFADNSHVFYFD